MAVTWRRTLPKLQTEITDYKFTSYKSHSGSKEILKENIDITYCSDMIWLSLDTVLLVLGNICCIYKFLFSNEKRTVIEEPKMKK